MSLAFGVVVLGMAATTARAGVENMTRTAHTAASRGDCATVEFLARQVLDDDPEYFAAVFTKDPEIAKCRLGERQDAPPRPPPRPYRRKVIISDLVAIGAMGLAIPGLAINPESPGYGVLVGLAGFVAYLAVPPILHASRRRPGRALLSLALRALAPSIGAGMGEAVVAARF